MFRMLPLSCVLCLLAGAAHAQIVGPPPAGLSDYDRHRWEAERHRQDMEAQRREADRRQAEAVWTLSDGRTTAARIEASRAPALPYPGDRQPAPTPTIRPNGGFPPSAPVGGIDQIDAWLSRPY
jgi:hypothetical protein